VHLRLVAKKREGGGGGEEEDRPKRPALLQMLFKMRRNGNECDKKRRFYDRHRR